MISISDSTRGKKKEKILLEIIQRNLSTFNLINNIIVSSRIIKTLSLT